MKVLALGGSGGMGRHPCRIAARLTGVDEPDRLRSEEAVVITRSWGPCASEQLRHAVAS
jgi:hypothetical protein